MAAGLWASKAQAAEGPDPTAHLHCLDQRGAVLNLRNATVAGLVAAYQRRDWASSPGVPAANELQIVFSPIAVSATHETATFALEKYRDGFVVTSIVYRNDAQIEKVTKGEVCFRLIGILN